MSVNRASERRVGGAAGWQQAPRELGDVLSAAHSEARSDMWDAAHGAERVRSGVVLHELASRRGALAHCRRSPPEHPPWRLDSEGRGCMVRHFQRARLGEWPRYNGAVPVSRSHGAW